MKKNFLKKYLLINKKKKSFGAHENKNNEIEYSLK
jgi:hypothetical protein